MADAAHDTFPPAQGGTCPAVKESAYDSELEDHHPRKVQGVYGAKSKSFAKKFKNQAAQDKFFDHPDREGNYEIHYVTKMHEDVEQIDELSLNTLDSYIDKASKQAANSKTKFTTNHYYNRTGQHRPDLEKKHFDRYNKRMKGIARALDKGNNIVAKEGPKKLKLIKTEYERQMDASHRQIYKEDLNEGITKVGTYMTKSGDALVLHRAEHDPKHHMLIRKNDGKVVAGHQGTSQEVHDKLTKEGGLSGSLHEAAEVEDRGTRHEMRTEKVLHRSAHVATIRTFRGRAGGWVSSAHTPDGKDASKKYGIDMMDTKKQMLSKIKKYHKEVKEAAESSSLDHVIGKVVKGLKYTGPAKHPRNVHDGKPVSSMKEIEVSDDHQKLFDHLTKKHGFQKTQGWDPRPDTWTGRTSHESMTHTTDPVHHSAYKVSVHVRQEHGSPKKLVFTKW